MAKPSKTQEQVNNFIAACATHGFTWTVKNPSVLMIEKRFTPGDRDAFTSCDMFGESVLGLAPLRGGSVWGTDGGSVGGHVGMTRGHYTLNKSGSGARFMKALANRVKSGCPDCDRGVLHYACMRG